MGDVLDKLKEIPGGTVQTCVTSPPYWGLRDYGHDGQIGLEKTPEEYVAKLVEVFREVKRVLPDDGTLWLNLGDSYVGANNTNNGGNANLGSQPGRTFDQSAKAQWKELPTKNLVGIPWRVAFALQADGWYLRSDIIWHKPNPTPESVTDRPTKSHEYIFLLSKSAKYYYDAEAIKETAVEGDNGRYARQNWDNKSAPDGRKNGIRPRQFGATRQDGTFRQDIGNTFTDNGTRNKRSVWTITTKPYSGAHFATFPPEIPELCIKAGSKVGDTVLDPFAGSGTTLIVAKELFRDFIGIELNEKYVKELIEPRLEMVDPLFTEAR